MTFVPFAYRSLYLKPFAMDGTTASGIVLQHHDKLAKIYGRVTAVHPSCRNVRVGDWVIFEPGRPERLSTREGAIYCLREQHVLGVVEPGDRRAWFDTVD